MKTIDVIILSYAKNDEIINMNNNCINSILNSTTNYKFNIIVVETDNQPHRYSQDCVTVIQPKCEFNYNKFLNLGLEKCKNEWILISNNDTIYKKSFIEEMLHAHNVDNNILSMSPIEDTWHCHINFDKNIDIHYGYRVPYEITGWSIFVHKNVIDIIGKFDETFEFWYQDNDYSNNLIKNNIKHALITKSRVEHLVSKSHDLINQDKKHQMTEGMFIKFVNKWLKK